MSSHPPLPAELVPAWRYVLSADFASHAQDRAASFVQLATLSADGFPANRTLTFRTFGDGGELVFTTDLRSSKCDQISSNQRCEACWYFADARVQWRLRGTLSVVGARSRKRQALREQVWARLSESSRERFGWPAPGLLKAGAHRPAGKPIPTTPPASFGLLILTPERAERLDLRAAPNRHQRWSPLRGQWPVTELTP